jgi:hypothetical protein
MKIETNDPFAEFYNADGSRVIWTTEQLEAAIAENASKPREPLYTPG